MNSNNDTIGLDLGDRKHYACVLDAAGEIVVEEVLVNTREVLTAFSARYPKATMVMETGPHSPWISRLLTAQGHRVIVANARKPRAISQSQTKSDREDARMLARLGRADPKLLSPVRHRSEATQRALVRLKVREALVRSRVNLVNSVRFLLKSLGVFVSSSIKAMAFTRKVRAQLAADDVALVAPLLTAIDAVNVELKQLDVEQETLARDTYPVTERLRQIPGVGPLTTLCFVLTLESPEDFADARRRALSRPGAATRSIRANRQTTGNHESGPRAVALSAGQLRALYPRLGRPCALRAAGERIAARGGKPARKRAVILTLLALWKSGADYQPGPLAHAA
jgi:transposase